MTLAERLYRVHRAECRDLLIRVLGKLQSWLSFGALPGSTRQTSGGGQEPRSSGKRATVDRCPDPTEAKSTATGQAFVAAAKEL